MRDPRGEDQQGRQGDLKGQSSPAVRVIPQAVPGFGLKLVKVEFYLVRLGFARMLFRLAARCGVKQSTKPSARVGAATFLDNVPDILVGSAGPIACSEC